MAGNFSFDIEGLEPAQAKLRAVAGRPKERVKHLLTRAAIAGAATMKANVPNNSPHKSTGGMFRAIEANRARYQAGGAGGGGTWIAEFGPIRTPETVDASGHSYISNVFHGTGLYGPKGSFIKASPGNIMVIDNYKPRDLDLSKKNPFVSREGPIFAKSTRGQRPQREWFDEGRDRAELIISTNLHRVFDLTDSMEDI